MAPKRFGRRLYQPVGSAGELAELTEVARIKRDRIALWLRFGGLFCCALALLNLFTTGFKQGLSPVARWWSIIPILVIGLSLLARATLAFRLRPRALAVHGGLLSLRDLRHRESEIQHLEERIHEGLTSLANRRPGLEQSFERLRIESASRISAFHPRQSQGLRRLWFSPAPVGAGADPGEHQRAMRRLDAYRLALGNIESDTLLHPNFFDLPAASSSFDRALSLLRPPELGSPVAVTGSEQDRHSIAILPFKDLSPGRDQEYFSSGLAEELIHALTKIESLRVIARGSVASAVDADVGAVGRKLDVETVVNGSVRKAGEQLRITVQMTRIADGAIVWSERYDRGIHDIFTVQDELTAAVVDQLRGKVLTAAPGSPERRRTKDLEAYHLYLKGRHLWGKRTPADLTQSIVVFEQAIDRDPQYALAWAALADSFNLLGYYSVLAPRESFPRAAESAARAIALDGTLGEAHCSLAFARLLFDWDWRAAGREFERAFELNPGYATAHHWFAEYLLLLGRYEEAIEQAKTALGLDPLSPIINVLLGWTYYYSRRCDEAIESLLQTLELDDTFAPAEFWLGLAYEQKGRFDEAVAALDRAVAHSDRSPMMLAALGRMHAELGRSDEAEAILEELLRTAKKRYVPCYYIAGIHSGAADTARTFEWLERSCKARESWMIFLEVDPIWDKFRDHGRFRALIEEVGLGAEEERNR